MDPALVRTSRFLSLVLRHDPARIGLTLDEAGWADVGELVERSRAAGVELPPAVLHEVVTTNDKQRFALSPDGRRIRANQGHSVPVDLGLPAVPPPGVLFHGTSRRALPAILAQGLLPRGRHAVHLSGDRATALAVGRRHGSAVVLEVDAGRMHADGRTFARSANGVWLTAAVPAEYLTVAPTGDR